MFEDIYIVDGEEYDVSLMTSESKDYFFKTYPNAIKKQTQQAEQPTGMAPIGEDRTLMSVSGFPSLINRSDDVYDEINNIVQSVEDSAFDFMGRKIYRRKPNLEANYNSPVNNQRLKDAGFDTFESYKEAIESAMEARTKIEDENQSYFETIVQEMGFSGSKLGEMIARMPGGFYDTAALFINPINRAIGIEEVNSSTAFGGVLQDNFLIDFFVEEQEEWKKSADFYKNKNFDHVSIFEAAKAGNYGDAFGLAGTGLAESFGVSTSMLVGGYFSKGTAAQKALQLTGTFTPVFAGQEIYQMRQENPDMSNFEATLKGIGMAGAETIFAAVNNVAMGNVLRSIIIKEGREQGGKIINQGLIKMYETMLKKYGVPIGALGEGIEEVATQTTQNALRGRPLDENVMDAFLLGVSGGAVYSSPITVAQGASAVNDAVVNYKVNRILKNSKYDNIYDAFKDAKANSDDFILRLVGSKASEKQLINEIKKKIADGDITKEEGEATLKNFLLTKSANNAISKLNLNSADAVKAIDLLKQKNELILKIKEIGDDNLAKSFKDKLNKINQQLDEISDKITEAELEENIRFTKEFAPKFGAKVYDQYKTKEEFAEATGKDKDADGAFINGDIYINKARALETKAVSVGSHELLHKILEKALLDPTQRVKLINQFRIELQKRDILDVVEKRINENYKFKFDEEGNVIGENNFEEYAEEYLTAFSDAIVKGEIQYEENFMNRLARIFEPVLQKYFPNIKFTTGRDLYDFVKSYSLNVKRGTLTSRKPVDEVGLKGDALSVTISQAAQKARNSLNSIQDKATVNGVFNKEAYLREIELNKDKISETITGMIDARGKSLIQKGLKLDLEEYTQQVNFELLVRNDLNKFDGTGQLYGFMNQRVKFASLDAFTNNKTIVKNFDDVNISEFENVLGSTDTREDIDDDGDSRKINPTSVIKNETLRQKYIKDVKERLKLRKPKSLSDPGLGLDILAEEIGVPLSKLQDPAKNLTYADTIITEKNISEFIEDYPGIKVGMIVPSEAGKIQNYIKRNSDFRLFMPPQNTVPDDTQRNIRGISLNIFPSLLKYYYKATGKRSKGVRTQPGIKVLIQEKVDTADNFNAGFGIVKGKTDTYNRDIGQRLKAFPRLLDKLMTNFLEGETVTPSEKQAVRAGKPKALLSKTKQEFKNELKELSFDEQGFGMKTGSVFNNRATPYKRKPGDPVRSRVTVPERKKGFEAINKFNEFTNDKYNGSIRKGITNRSSSFADGVVEYDNEVNSNNLNEIFSRFIYKGKDINKRLGYFTRKFFKENIKINKDNFIKQQQDQLKLFHSFMEDVQSFIHFKDKQGNKPNLKYGYIFEEIMQDAQNNQNHFLKTSAVINFYPVDSRGNPVFNVLITEEHTGVSVGIARLALMGVRDNHYDLVKDIIDVTYMQGGLRKIVDTKLGKAESNGGLSMGKSMGKDFDVLIKQMIDGKANLKYKNLFSLIRYLDPRLTNFRPHNYMLIKEGATITKHFGVDVPSSLQTSQIIDLQKKLIRKIILNEITEAQAKNEIKAVATKRNIKQMNAASKNNQALSNSTVNVENVFDQIEILSNIDKAAMLSRTSNKPKKGISVFDFDDTLARTKSKVIVTMPDGKTSKINATEFAARSADLESEGAVFDFSEFNKVIEGKKGPLAELALKRQGKFGSGDIFVLTARPQASAESIQKFLKGIGLDIPIENITGLEDGRPQAKANWIISKVAQGYNDFYFADDAIKNVNAVKEVLDQADVKSDVQQALLSKSKSVDRQFNDIIEQKTGVDWFKEYSKAKARRLGKKKGFKIIMPFSTQDFQGLIKHITPSGKVGDIAEAWFEEKLFKPFARAEASLARMEITIASDYKQLKKMYPGIPKTLHEEAIDGLTYSDVIRVYIWNKQGYEIDGLSKSDLKQVNDFVNKNAEVKSFAEGLESIQKGRPYPKPDTNWQGGTINSDLVSNIRKNVRAEYLQEWQENVDQIFSEKNINKLEAQFGTSYVESLRDLLKRMKAGVNRFDSKNKHVNLLMEWTNGSVGAIMFLNTRTAFLQMISNVNFLNWSDNNIYEAGKAIANIPQYVKDIKFLMNSPMLLKRRQGLRINVAESELADASRQGGVRGLIALLLRKGFIFTQIADSLAIATGGAPMYRNRVNTYLNQGFSQEAAEEKAFLDFQEIAEETQQSSRTDRISMQQASDIGRIVLAFANTPMQYNRLIQKSVSDLINKRGDARTHISKILYYSTIQNFIFNGLQQALFALPFIDDDDTFDEEQKEEFKQKKIFSTVNGMLDSLLRGGGYAGAAASAIKNAVISLYRQSEKQRPEYEDAAIELLKFSPPISSKYTKITRGLRTFSWDQDEIVEKGFSLENPALLAGGQILSGFTNVPLDRAIRKTNNISAAIHSDNSLPIRVMTTLGWSEGDFGLEDWQIEKREKERIKKLKDKLKQSDFNSKFKFKSNLNRHRTKLSLKRTF